MKIKCISLLLFGLASLSGISYADNGQLYMGASVGISDFTTGVSNMSGATAVDSDDTGYSLMGGFRISKSASLEARYSNYGDAVLTGDAGDTFEHNGITYAFNVNNESISMNGTSFGLSWVLSQPLSERISVHGKLGLERWDFDVSTINSLVSAKMSGSSSAFLYGAGLDVKLNDDYFVRMDVTALDNINFTSDTGDAGVMFSSIGLAKNF